MTAGAPDVQYVVLPDPTNPYLLARVRWPDIFQAISPIRPEWQDDPGLFDLPYDPNSWPVTLEQAATIAAGWGAHLPTDDAPAKPRPLMRRMPANWSNLSRAEKRAWSIETIKPAKPAAAAVDDESAQSPDVRPSRPQSARRRWRRRHVTPALEVSELPQPELVLTFTDESTDVLDLTEPVLDLTETGEDALAIAEDA